MEDIGIVCIHDFSSSNQFVIVNTCGVVGFSVGFIESRFVYNFGAEDKTTGVGSELYDFSGGAECSWDMNVGTNAGTIGGGGTLFNIGAGFVGGCCCNFC